jgi:hypothetical protein
MILIIYAAISFGFINNCFTDLMAQHNVLGLRFWYTREDIFKLLGSLNLEELKCYRDFMPWDNLTAILYTPFFSCWLAYIIKTGELSKYNFAIFIPFIAGLLDYLENTFELFFIQAHMQAVTITESTAFWGSTLTLIKWLIILIMLALMAVVFFKRIKK